MNRDDKEYIELKMQQNGLGNIPKMFEEQLIPVDTVIDDMYSSNSVISDAARDYYYIHYADKESRDLMDWEDKFTGTLAIALVVFLVFVLVAIIFFS